ncbi:hypothetical protein UlMin_018822 [Ulmus minor]
MPSGAKKRKAAKKKKEQEAHIGSSSNNPQGNDDSKSEKGSDGGEVNSPAHQDYQNHDHPFNEGNGERGDADSLSVRSIDVEDKSAEKVGLQDDDVVKVERGLKSAEGTEDQNIRVEHVKSTKESYDGSSSSSSSSDDESRAIEKKQNKESKNIVPETTSHTDDVKLVNSSPPEAAQITENAYIEEMSDVIGSVKPVVPVSEETLNVIESAPVENELVSNVIKSELENGSEKVSPEAAENVSDFQEKENKASPSELDSVLKGSAGTHVAQSSNGAYRAKDSEIPEYSENQPLVASAPRPVERTSCLSCCGIFDVITGSSR